MSVAPNPTTAPTTRLADLVASTAPTVVEDKDPAVDLTDAKGAAKAFWATLAKGNYKGLKKFYADKVILRAGSELLKDTYGLNPSGDRTKDLSVDRDAVISGYKIMIESVGTDRWNAELEKIKPDELQIAEKANKAGWPDDKGDLLTLKVDALIFAFAKDEDGNWRIVAELSDY